MNDIDYIWRIHGYDVYYSNATNGGGDYFALEYMQVIKDWYPYKKFEKCLEWCSGPGFIGFGIYASLLCEKISFIDKYEPAVEQLNRTKTNKGKTDDTNVTVYHGDSLSIIPEDEQFDLIVGNPPHWNNEDDAKQLLGNDIDDHMRDILIDKEWAAHKDFFAQAKLRLSEKGVILLQENDTGSDAKVFEPMIKEAGLQIKSVGHSQMYENIYYLEVVHAKG